MKTHQAEQRILKATLDALQKKLAECYKEYELDEKVAQRDYSVLLYRWIQEMIIGARIGHLPSNAT